MECVECFYHITLIISLRLIEFCEFRLVTTSLIKTRNMSNDADERYVYLTNRGTSEVPVFCLFRQAHAFCQFLFLFGRVVDEVEALKAILMDELIVRTNERLVVIFICMFHIY
jgi:hypothetical protein